MELEKLKKINDGMYSYQTDQFATIKLSFIFTLPENIDEKTFNTYRILSSYLTKTNQKYKMQKEINDRCKYYYNMKNEFSLKIIKHRKLIYFEVELLDPKVIGDNYFEDAIKFAYDILFKPDFENGKLNQEVLGEIKKNIINGTKLSFSIPQTLKDKSFFEKINPNSFLCEYFCTSIEDFEKNINSIIDKDIINAYHEMMKNLFYRGFIFGNVTDSEINFITNLFPFKTSKKNIDFTKIEHLNSGYYEEENNNCTRSTVYVAYEIADYEKNKEYLYEIILRMLSSKNGLCLEILRDELGIAYSARVIRFIETNFFFIKVDISSENKDKCLDGIDKVLKRLQDTNTIKNLLYIEKEKMLEQDFNFDENVQSFMYEIEKYITTGVLEDGAKRKNIEDIKVDDVINQSKKLVKKYVYFNRGIRNDK